MTTREISAAPLLTTGEVAAALRVTSQTVRSRVADGTLRAVRLGGVIRIPASEVSRLLEGTHESREK